MRVWMGSTRSSSWSTDLGMNLGALAMMRKTLFCNLWRSSRWLFPAAPQMAQPSMREKCLDQNFFLISLKCGR
ncbi:hypothetical protein TNCV_2316541 [Trichonephila clavipes]|nr:hypothetical protein TNCV_2316541 [Trichonephila clavipes]